MNPVTIRTINLTRRFGSVTAVEDLSLEVARGTIFGFLGPNGAGKTTTIRLLLGLLEPTSGKAEVLGLDTVTDAAAIRARTGALLEHPGLYERLTAADNLEFFGRACRIPTARRRARIETLLKDLDLWKRRHEMVRTWSRGMRQKLAVARALLHRPDLLFLDEPTNGLDPVAAANLRETLAAMVARDGTTVFLTTHNLSEAERLCDQVGVIRSGRLLAAGTLSALRARSGPARLEVRGSGFTQSLLAAVKTAGGVTEARVEGGRLLLSLESDREAADLVTLLVQHGARVHEVGKVGDSLEDVFLDLMEDERP